MSWFNKIIFGKGAVRLISLVLLFVFWWWLSSLQVVDKTLLASPGEVVKVLADSFKTDVPKSRAVHLHAFASIKLAIKGWALSMLFGAVLGVVTGRIKWLSSMIEPQIDFFRSIPPILAFPLLLVAFNYEVEAYIGTIIFGCLPIVVITVLQGVKTINDDPFKILRQNKVNRRLKNVLYSIELLPTLVLSGRLSFSFALIIGIVCEMVFTPRSGWALGALARDSEINFDTPLFYACVLLIGCFGYLANRLLIAAENRF